MDLVIGFLTHYPLKLYRDFIKLAKAHAKKACASVLDLRDLRQGTIPAACPVGAGEP